MFYFDLDFIFCLLCILFYRRWLAFWTFFAAGLVAVPFYLWKLYKIEKEEKDNALIQRMPTLQDYFNKNKKKIYYT